MVTKATTYEPIGKTADEATPNSEVNPQAATLFDLIGQTVSSTITTDTPTTPVGPVTPDVVTTSPLVVPKVDAAAVPKVDAAAVPKADAVAEALTTYTIQSGDTFSKIASENTFTLDQLKAANPDITDFNNVMIGKEINLPVEGAPVVEAPNTPEQTKEVVIEQLPTEIAENVQQTEGDSPTDINRAIFDGASFSGALPTPEVGDDAITWIADNAYGIEEENPEFRRAMRGLLQGIDPDKQPWCAAFAGHIFRSLGVEVPSLAQQNPNLAWNYQDIGEEVYNHNPTTGRTYAGSLDAVQTGDVIIFNKNPNRQSDGSFGWGKGHISFVVDVEEDGTILAIGGNQQDRVQTSRYSPDTIRRYYEGGFRVRRITTQSLEQTSPEVIASITAGIAAGGAGN